MIKCLIFLAVPAVLSPLVILVGPLLVGSSPTGESSPEGESSRGVGGARKVAEGGRGNSSLQPTATPSQIRLGGRLNAFQILGLETKDNASVDRYSDKRAACSTLQGNPIYVFLFWESGGLSLSFHVSVSDLYILRIGPHIFLQQNRQTDPRNI
jgi:hypothetical protein